MKLWRVVFTLSEQDGSKESSHEAISLGVDAKAAHSRMEFMWPLFKYRAVTSDLLGHGAYLLS